MSGTGTIDDETYFERDEGVQNRLPKNTNNTNNPNILEKAITYSHMLKKYPFKVTFEDPLPSNILTPAPTTTDSTSTARPPKKATEDGKSSGSGTLEKHRAGSSTDKNSGGTGPRMAGNDLLHSSSLKKKGGAKKSKKLFKDVSQLSFFPPIPKFDSSDDEKENFERKNRKKRQKPMRRRSSEFQFPKTYHQFEDTNMERLRLGALLRGTGATVSAPPLSIAHMLASYPKPMDYIQPRYSSAHILEELGRQISVTPERRRPQATRRSFETVSLETEEPKRREQSVESYQTTKPKKESATKKTKESAKQISHRKAMKKAPFFTKTSGLDQVSFSLPGTHQELLGTINKTHPAFLSLAKQLLQPNSDATKKRKQTEDLCEAFLKAIEKRRDMLQQKIARLHGLYRNSFHERRKKLQSELNVSKQSLKECNQIIHRLESAIFNLEHGAANPGTTAPLNQLHILHRVFEN